MSDELPQPKTDFISCATCGATYPAYRSPVCPHPIPRNTPKLLAEHGVPVAKDADGWPLGLGGAVVGVETGLAVIPKRKRKPTPKPGPRVFEGHWYEQQPWEKKRQGWKRWRAFSLWMSLKLNGDGTFAQVGRQLGYSDQDLIERWAKEDQWPMRLDAYLSDRAKAERRAFEKKVKRQADQDFALVSAGKAIIAAEYDKVMKEIEAGGATGLDFADLTTAFEKLTKLGRLLVGESTGHLTVDSPEIARQRKFQGAVLDARELLQDFLKDEPDASEERVEYLQNQAIDWAATNLQVDRSELAAAIGGKIDQTSSAEN